MERLTASDITVMFLSLGVLLAVARTLGELAQRFHQPAVLGEITAGLLLGPTVLGTVAPEWTAWLFPESGPNAVLLEGLSTLGVALFLLVAGMEVDLSTVWRQGRIALKVGTAGIVAPFALGFAAAWFAPEALGRHSDTSALIFALFFATALSISSLPVIAKTLMDLNLYRSDFGMVIISAAIYNDLLGWIIFAIILGMMGGQSGEPAAIGMSVLLVLSFAGVMLSVGRGVVHRVLPWLQAYTHSPGGVLCFSLSLAMFGAAFAEGIGVHAIFGSFLVGIAVGDSSHLREQTRTIIDQFISFFFAPLFFASIGLRVNFFTHFETMLVLNVLAVACLGKVAGCLFGAWWGGMPRREGWAVSVAMNARGAMEIILGLLALQAGLIRERLFVALVVMALVTSMISGPVVQLILGRRKPRHLSQFLAPKAFLRRLQAANRREAIHELVEAACEGNGHDAAAIEEAVIAREEAMHTGVGHGVAVPHARIPQLSRPLVAIGMSEAGIDFDAPDGESAHIIVLILTSPSDDGTQLELLSFVGKTFSDRLAVERALRTRGLTEFVALLKSGAM